MLKFNIILRGDANGDGKVDKNDLEVVSLYIMGTTVDGFLFKAADANDDNSVNAADIVRIINIIRKNLPAD